MLYLIDTVNWKLLAGCDTLEQAEYLADLLAPKTNTHVDDMGFDGLECFTNEELAKIYGNTVGDPITNARDRDDRDFLVGLLLNIINNVYDDRSSAILFSALGRLPHKMVAKPAAEPKTAVTPRSGGTGGGTRTAGAKAVIFELADKAWEAAGKPMDTKEVLKLRKQWMNDWEANEGIKKTTASSTLGLWQKERLIS